MPLGKPHADPRLDEADQVIPPEAIHMAAALEQPAVNTIADAMPVRNGDVQTAGRFENPPDLFKRGIQFQNMLERMIADYEVDSCRGDGQSFATSDDVASLAIRDGRRSLAGSHILVDRDDGTIEAREGKTPAGGSEVQDPVLLTQIAKPIVQGTAILAKRDAYYATAPVDTNRRLRTIAKYFAIEPSNWRS